MGGKGFAAVTAIDFRVHLGCDVPSGQRLLLPCRVPLSFSLSLSSLFSRSRALLDCVCSSLWPTSFEQDMRSKRGRQFREKREERARERKGGEGRECPIVAASHHFLPAIRAFLKELPTDCSFFLCLSSSLSLPHLRLRDSCAGELGPAGRGLLDALFFLSHRTITRLPWREGARAARAPV